jgi:agmatinase
MRTLAILGVPFDAYSSFLRGPAQAPPLILEAFHSNASNSWSEVGVDLSAPGAVTEVGDVDVPSEDRAFEEITTAITHILAQEKVPISLGGDHSITYPILQAIGPKYPNLTIVHFDAHPDLYDVFQGNRHSHACPFARIMENRLAARLIQIGIRTLNAHQREQAQRFGVQQFDMNHLPSPDVFGFDGPVYISFDIDGLDPAFAPGVSHREPGGLSVRDAIRYIHAISGQIVGADIVEYNPEADLDRITAVVAAKILKEIAGVTIRNNG